MGGAQSVKNNIASEISAKIVIDVSEDSNIVQRVDQMQIININNCNVRGDVDMKQVARVDFTAFSSSVSNIDNQQTLTNNVTSAVEQTMQNFQLNLTGQQNATDIVSNSNIVTHIRNAVKQGCLSAASQSQTIQCKDSNIDGAIHMSQVSDMVMNCMLKNEQTSKSLDQITSTIMAENKQGIENGLLGIILAIALVMVIFALGPVIVAGEATGYVFKTLAKTPSTRLILLFIVFGIWYLYVDSDCGGGQPVFNISFPPDFIREIIPGVTIPYLFTIPFLPSWCTVKDGEGGRKVRSGRKAVVFAITFLVFGTVGYNLVQATKGTRLLERTSLDVQ
jgi:hypothetical protein